MRVLLVLVVAALAACSTPQSRIKHHRDVFDAAPPEVREKIKKGRIDIGFSPDEVYLALGKPTRTIVNKIAGEPDQEIWIYRGPSGDAGVGVGFGLFSGGPVSTGLAVGTREPARAGGMRVVFQNDEVVEIRQER